MKLNELKLPNAMWVTDELVSAGQPDPDQFRDAADAGVRTIVNMCAPGECGWDEAGLVDSLGMTYVNIPVCGMGDINADNASLLNDVLADASAYPMVLHCGSGNRVGALVALNAFVNQGYEPEDAVARGKKAGLAMAEPTVRDRIATLLAKNAS